MICRPKNSRNTFLLGNNLWNKFYRISEYF